jgi:hypothetical protein
MKEVGLSNRRKVKMGSLGRYVLIAMIAAVLTAVMYAPQVWAQGLGGGFLLYSPTQWSGSHYAPGPRYQRYQTPSGKQAVRRGRAVRSAKPTRSSRGREAMELRVNSSSRKRKALAVPRGSASVSPRVTCEKAQTIVAAYDFTDVKAQVCVGKVLRFTAIRDGKPFAIQIAAANGELAKVRRLR